MASAAVQADLMEKEKHITTVQQKLNMLKTQLQHIANRHAALERERRRCQITSTELGKYNEGHKVYKSLGRAFVMMPKPELVTDLAAREKSCETEVAKLLEDKKKLVGAIESDETSLQRDVNEYMQIVQNLQLKLQQAAGSDKK
jgi:prefoldin subunit 1